MSLPAAFISAVERLIPRERRFDDPLSTLAFGTDASFYRLIPQLVLRVGSEAEVVVLLPAVVAATAFAAPSSAALKRSDCGAGRLSRASSGALRPCC